MVRKVIKTGGIAIFVHEGKDLIPWNRLWHEIHIQYGGSSLTVTACHPFKPPSSNKGEKKPWLESHLSAYRNELWWASPGWYDAHLFSNDTSIWLWSIPTQSQSHFLQEIVKILCIFFHLFHPKWWTHYSSPTLGDQAQQWDSGRVSFNSSCNFTFLPVQTLKKLWVYFVIVEQGHDTGNTKASASEM